MKKIGFIGLGIMGKPMAKNLLKAGHSLVVCDIQPDPVQELVRAGAEAGRTPADVAARTEIIITMLPNSPEVMAAVFGADGVAAGIRSGSILVDMSSIAPSASRQLAERLAPQKVAVLDAPVSGGEPKAIDGTLAIMVGGPQATFDEVRPILAAMGSSVTLVGEIGSGNITKLANQMIVALNIAAMGEALVLAKKAGTDPARVFEAIRGGLAGSTVLEAKVPKVLAGNFKPGFRVALHIKDLANALDTAHEIGVPVPLTSQVMEILQALKVDGRAQEDHCSIVRFYEDMARTEVRK